MRLNAEQHPERIRRYVHIRPAARGTGRCAARYPGTRRTCTRRTAHSGPHVSHDWRGKVRAVWGAAANGPEAVPRLGKGGSAGGVTREKDGRPEGSERRAAPANRTGFEPSRTILAVRWMRTHLPLPSSVEEVCLLILFLAFAWFAVDWVLLMMGWG